MIALRDNGSVEKSLEREGSKKARVIKLAKTDPFLSVDEIARMVGTTSRYVRTSLSEAGIILTDLRRRFADEMRQRLAEVMRHDQVVPAAVANDKDAGHAEPIPEQTRCIRVAQLVDAEAAALLREQPDAPLLEISRLRLVNGQPLYVNQLVTTGRLTLNEQLMTQDGPMYKLLDQVIAGAAKPMLDRCTVDIVPANSFFAELLRVKPGHPLLRSGTSITTVADNKPIAVELNYFDALRVRLELETAPQRALRVIERYRDG